METDKCRPSIIVEFSPCNWSDNYGLPKNTKSLNHKYNVLFSQVLLTVCNAKYKFISVDIGQCRSTIDSPVPINFELGGHLESYSLNIPSEDIADENNFKDGQPFTSVKRLFDVPLPKN